jgi:hypothetical protein
MGTTLNLSGRVYDDAGDLYGSGLTITLYNAATSGQVGDPLTPATGAWEFTGLDDTLTYRVEIRNGQSKRVIYCGTKQQLAELQVSGGVRFKNTLAIEGATSGAAFSFTGNGTVGGTLGVTGATTLNGLDVASGNITLATSATVDGVDISAFKSAYDTHAANVDGHHAKSHAHNGSDGSGTVAHSATTGRTENDHHNKVHNHTSTAEGGTLDLNFCKESSFTPWEARAAEPSATSYANGVLGWTFSSTYFPGTVSGVARFNLAASGGGSNPSGGLWDVTANGWAHAEQSGNGDKSVAFTPQNNHQYVWRVKNADTNYSAYCKGYILIRTS